MLFRGNFVADARGSAGGITASRNRSGAYLRKRVTPTNVPTSRRSTARANLASQAAAWQALSSTNKDEWNAVADVWTTTNMLGETIKLSGFNWFCRCNASLATGLQTAVTIPPVDIPTTELHPPTNLVLDTSADTFTADVDDTDPWAGSATARLNVFITAGQNPGRLSPAGGFTLLGSFPGNGTPVTSITTGTVPVPIIDGRVYFLRFVAVDALGRTSAPVTLRTVAVP